MVTFPAASPYLSMKKPIYYLTYSDFKEARKHRKDKFAKHDGDVRALFQEWAYQAVSEGVETLTAPEGLITHPGGAINPIWPSLNTMGFYRVKKRITEAQAFQLSPALVIKVEETHAKALQYRKEMTAGRRMLKAAGIEI